MQKNNFTLPFVGVLMSLFFFAVIWVTTISQGDSTQTTLNVTNAAPSVTNIIFATSSGGNDVGSTNIVLTEFSTTSVFIRGTITDSNGCGEVATSGSAYINFGLDTNVPACSQAFQNDYDCYYLASTNNRCAFGVTNSCSSPTDTSVDFECDFHLQYYATPSATGTPDAIAHWRAFLRAQDADGANSSTIRNTEVEALIAINVSSSINYGSLSVGATSSVGVPLNVINTGNITVDLNLIGTDLTCSVLGTIPANNQQFELFDSFDFGSAYVLSNTSSQLVEFDLLAGVSGFPAEPNNQNLYWKIQIPNDGVAGNCTGTTTVLAEQSI